MVVVNRGKRAFSFLYIFIIITYFCLLFLLVVIHRSYYSLIAEQFQVTLMVMFYSNSTPVSSLHTEVYDGANSSLSTYGNEFQYTITVNTLFYNSSSNHDSSDSSSYDSPAIVTTVIIYFIYVMIYSLFIYTFSHCVIRKHLKVVEWY